MSIDPRVVDLAGHADALGCVYDGWARRGWGRTGATEMAVEETVARPPILAQLFLQELHRRVRDPAQMRALGFCVSVEHARFMARCFEEAGIASVAVTGDTPGSERDWKLTFHVPERR